MNVRLTISVSSSEVCVEIDEEGHRVETLLLPPQEDAGTSEHEFELDLQPEFYGPVSGLVLPKGYFAIGVFQGKSLMRILLSGPNLSVVVTSVREANVEVAANQARIDAAKPQLPGLRI